jgi:acetyltransferase-like isoleucine patch superfamily enzyme
VGVLSRLAWTIQCFRWKKRFSGFHADLLAVGQNVVVEEGVRIYGSSALFNCTIGRGSYVSSARLSNVQIGAFCSVGHDALVGGLGRHPTDMLSTHPAFYSNLGQSGLVFADKQHFAEQAKVTVGNDVWIGARAIVLDGLDVGDGAIIAAGAVVTKDVPAYSIVAGVPARVLRLRFSDDEVKTLQELEWWRASNANLAAWQSLFRSRDIRGLAIALRNSRGSVAGEGNARSS